MSKLYKQSGTEEVKNNIGGVFIVGKEIQDYIFTKEVYQQNIKDPFSVSLPYHHCYFEFPGLFCPDIVLEEESPEFHEMYSKYRSENPITGVYLLNVTEISKKYLGQEAPKYFDIDYRIIIVTDKTPNLCSDHILMVGSNKETKEIIFSISDAQEDRLVFSGSSAKLQTATNALIKLFFACTEVNKIINNAEVIQKEGIDRQKSFYYTGRNGVEYKTLSLNPLFKTKYQKPEDYVYVYKGIVRRHKVREHERHLSGGRVIKVREHEKGNIARGYVHKEYEVEVD